MLNIFWHFRLKQRPMEAVFLVLCFCCCTQTFMPFEWSTGSTDFALNYTHSSKQIFLPRSLFIMVAVHVFYLFHTFHHITNSGSDFFLFFTKSMELNSPAHFEVCLVLKGKCSRNVCFIVTTYCIADWCPLFIKLLICICYIKKERMGFFSFRTRVSFEVSNHSWFSY